MIIIVNRAECWQYLSVKANILLSELLAAYSYRWTCYRISSVPKTVVFRMTTNRGLYTPYTCEHCISLRPSHLPYPFRQSPPISVLYPSPPFFPLSRSIFFLLYLLLFSPSSPFHPVPSRPRFPYPLKRGPEVISRKFFGFLPFCTLILLYF
jgi:hypothetical protein